MNRLITWNRFDTIARDLLDYVIDESYKSTIRREKIYEDLFHGRWQISYDELLGNNKRSFDPIRRAFFKLVILADYSLSNFYENKKINTSFVWRILYDSLSVLKKQIEHTTIGSQGFVSIELYRKESVNRNVKILRLHLWDLSFTDKFEKQHQNKYVIHSHLFNAQSHVLSGTILNKRYRIKQSESETNQSLYQINWKEEKVDNQIKRSSYLEESIKNITIDELSSEEVSESQSYSIPIGEFHSSQSITFTKPSATLFLFDSQKGKSQHSKVVAPKNDSTPGFKYQKVNVQNVIHQIDRDVRNQNDEHRNLGLDWMRKIHTLEHAHRIESRYFKTFNELLGWSLVVLPAVVTAITIVISRIENTNWGLPVLSISAAIITILGTISRAKQPGNQSEKHRLNSESFEHLRHKLERHIVFHNDERLEEHLEEVRLEWKRLSLLNVKENHFIQARKIINDLGKYPENLGFLNDYFPK